MTKITAQKRTTQVIEHNFDIDAKNCFLKSPKGTGTITSYFAQYQAERNTFIVRIDEKFNDYFVNKKKFRRGWEANFEIQNFIEDRKCEVQNISKDEFWAVYDKAIDVDREVFHD